MSGHPVERPPAVLDALAVARKPEALLIQTLIDITNNRLDAALTEVDRIVHDYPHFRLAQLVRGDLLLARARPITTLGSARDAPEARIAALREEAKVRLARYRDEKPSGRVPRSLVQLQPHQKYAFVVDTSKYTLYVFENVDGTPRYIADYYTTIGKNGIGKEREGDKKTPVGVYHVTSRLPRERLNRLYGNEGARYGDAAYPISYPNEWDRRRGRNGHGIWLHGVPFDTYSRPPRASDGCVALTNEDLESIGRSVQVGLTPVVISDNVEWVTPATQATLRRDLTGEIDAWRRDWESLDSTLYLAHYSPHFSAAGEDLQDWARHKRAVNARKTWIKVGISDTSILLSPGSESALAVVTFEQDYASSNFSERNRKRQYWIKEGKSWKIIYEGPA